MPFCSNCGATVAENSKFCPNCGTGVVTSAAAVTPLPQTPPPPQTPPVQEAPSQFQQQQYQQYQYAPPPPPPKDPSLVGKVMGNALQILLKKPIRLWGLSLMGTLLIVLAYLFGYIPIIAIPIALTLKVGMCAVYLDGYAGKEDLDTDQIFYGFKRFIKTACAMGWKELWILIWALIPFVGFIFAIIKGYAYSFVPYNILTDKSLNHAGALRCSMDQTEGYKGKMFLADFIVFASIAVVSLVLGLLSLIPYVGWLFGLVLFLFAIAAIALAPLYLGLIHARFFHEIVGAVIDNEEMEGTKTEE